MRKEESIMDLLKKMSQLDIDDYDYVSIKVYNKRGYWLAYYSGLLLQLKEKFDKFQFLVFKDLYIRNNINNKKAFTIEAINPLYK